jgi:hypothetical protein
MHIYERASIFSGNHPWWAMFRDGKVLELMTAGPRVRANSQTQNREAGKVGHLSRGHLI